jgi:hypothetical protein
MLRQFANRFGGTRMARSSLHRQAAEGDAE